MSFQLNPASNISEQTLAGRRLASMSEFNSWAEARINNITASDVSLLSGESSIPSVLSKKLTSNFYGNKYTAYGNAREPVIAGWIQENYGISGNDFVFHAEESKRHLATPDGLTVSSEGLLLAEIKTTNKPFNKIPLRYLRQVWWQQYVLGASRTLFVWEEHKDFVPVKPEPEFLWVERDDAKIAQLVRLADILLEEMDSRNTNRFPSSPYGDDDECPF